jgi:hypothetical protein
VVHCSKNLDTRESVVKTHTTAIAYPKDHNSVRNYLKAIQTPHLRKSSRLERSFEDRREASKINTRKEDPRPLLAKTTIKVYVVGSSQVVPQLLDESTVTDI